MWYVDTENWRPLARQRRLALTMKLCLRLVSAHTSKGFFGGVCQSVRIEAHAPTSAPTNLERCAFFSFGTSGHGFVSAMRAIATSSLANRDLGHASATPMYPLNGEP